MEANEATQMEMLFQEGGIADDGTTVDPVSGNDVPPGSMAEEVRDDIPAQLSEGEYVVPADVARYYGVKFFEDLRNEAKRGLAQMETDGRIGGEPVNQTMDNQAEGALTPEELAMLQEMGMAVGGMVPPADTEGYNKDGQVLYAAEGTDVSTKKDIDPNKPQFNAAMGPAFGGGFLSQSILNESTAPTSTTVTLYSPEGIGRALILPAEADLYDKLLSEGYTTDQVATTTETSIGEEEPDGGGRADQGYGVSESSGPSVSIGDMDATQVSEAFSNTFDPNSIGAKVGPTVAGLFAGPIGYLAGKGITALNSRERTALNEQADKLGLDLSTISDPNVDLSRENFKSDDFFNSAMESVALEGQTYNSGTESYSATGSVAPTSSLSPPTNRGTALSPPTNRGTDSTNSSSGSKGKGLGQSINDAVNSVADALGIGNNNAPSGDNAPSGGNAPSDNDNDSPGLGGGER